MILVCDTNVWVSAILFGGPPREILRLATTGKATICVSPAILAELEDVLARPKFGLSEARAQAILDLVRSTTRMVLPTRRFQVIAEDPDDDAILEAAYAAKANMVVSGDSHLLSLRKWRGILIRKPAEALDILKNPS